MLSFERKAKDFGDNFGDNLVTKGLFGDNLEPEALLAV